MTLPTCDVRYSLVLGHRLTIRLSEDGFWRVAVDGAEILLRYATAYAAWAMGAAESYRLGRAAGFAHSRG